MTRVIVGDERYSKAVFEKIGKESGLKFLAALPDFNREYEAWYSECLVLLKQLLSDRLANFISMYEVPKTRKSIEYGSYVIQDYLMGLTVTRMGREHDVGPSAALPKFRQQAAIIEAVKARFKSSLFDIKGLLQADVFDKELDAARSLMRSKYYRAAGVVCGVLLERHLANVASAHNVTIGKKNPSIGDWNEALKGRDIVTMPQWRNISLLSDYRNICCHAKTDEPTTQQVADLIDVTDKILRTVF